MPFLGCQRVGVGAVVQTVLNLVVPARTTRVFVQADTQNLRYTLDGATNPIPVGVPPGAVGMILFVGAGPTAIEGDVFQNIRFVEATTATPGFLNLHYWSDHVA